MQEIIISAFLIGVMLLFLHPSDLFMPMSLEASLTLLLVVSVLSYLGLIWKEHAHDERDNIHRQHAGRWSFITGLLVLSLGILVQNSRHNVDPWLIATVVVMVVTKVIARIYTRTRN